MSMKYVECANEVFNGGHLDVPSGRSSFQVFPFLSSAEMRIGSLLSEALPLDQ